MGKRLASYRVEEGLLAAVTVEAADRGETVTDVVIRAFQAYIRDGEAAPVPSAPRVEPSSVHTDSTWQEAYEESPVEPAENPCKHPAEAVEAGECGICHADVW